MMSSSLYTCTCITFTLIADKDRVLLVAEDNTAHIFLI